MQGACSSCGREGRIRRGLCDAHYFRWYRTGSIGSAEVWVKPKRSGVECEVEGCAQARKRGGPMCAKHDARVRRHGDPAVVRAPEARWGASNVMWSGDQVGYAALHARVRRGLGRASAYLCVCGVQAQEWAYRGGDPCEKTSPEGWRYSTDLTYYVSMCVACHRQMDRNPIAARGG